MPDIGRFKGVLFAISSGIIFALNSFVFSLLSQNFYVTDIAIFQYGLIIVFLFGWSFANGKSVFHVRKIGVRTQTDTTDWQMTGYLLAVGIAAAGVSLCLTFSFTFIMLTEAQAIFFTYSVWTLILARIFLNEKLGIVHILCVVCAVAGVILIMQPPFIFRKLTPTTVTNSTEQDSVKPAKKFLGYFLSLTAALSLGIHNVVVSKVSKTIPFVIPLFYCTAINFAFALALSIFQIIKLGVKFTLSWRLGWIVLAPITYVTAQIFLIKALQIEDAGLVGALGAVNIIAVLLLDFGRSKVEKMPFSIGPLKGTGIALIVAVVVISGLYKFIQHKRSSGRVTITTTTTTTNNKNQMVEE